jgi:hypothetical protein
VPSHGARVLEVRIHLPPAKSLRTFGSGAEPVGDDGSVHARENVGVVAARGRMLSSVRPLMRQDDIRRPVREFADRVQITQHTNGGLLLREHFASRISAITPSRCPHRVPATAESTRVMGRFLRDVMKLNLESRNFRLFSPDREQLEPVARCARGDEPRLGRRDPAL